MFVVCTVRSIGCRVGPVARILALEVGAGVRRPSVERLGDHFQVERLFRSRGLFEPGTMICWSARGARSVKRVVLSGLSTNSSMGPYLRS